MELKLGLEIRHFKFLSERFPASQNCVKKISWVSGFVSFLKSPYPKAVHEVGAHIKSFFKHPELHKQISKADVVLVR